MSIDGRAMSASSRLEEVVTLHRQALLMTLATFAAGIPASVHAQRVGGSVVDEATGQAVSSVGVVLLDSANIGRVFTSTDSAGAFSLAAPVPGRYRLRFQVPGYRMLVSEMLELTADQELEYPLTLKPIPPALLDTLIVEGQAVPKRLAGFYQRRSNSFGDHLTRDEFMKWNPVEVTDVLRRLKRLDVTPDPNSGRGYILHGGHQPTPCPPAIFYDGLFVGTSATYDVDAAFMVDNLAAVEAYRDGSGLPSEFWYVGSYSCGVLALWSSSGFTHGQSHHLDLAGFFGSRVGHSGLAEGRVGVSAAVNFAGALELYPAVAVIVPGLSHEVGAARSGWQALLALRLRPFGMGSPWYVGVGGAALSVNEDRGGLAGQEGFSREETYPVLLTGGVLPLLGATGPFAELEVFDFTSPGAAQVHVLLGVSLRVY